MRSPCIVHLRASNFVGGPEHQLLRYADAERDGSIQIHLATFLGKREGVEFLRVAACRDLRVFSLPSRDFGPRSALPALIRELRSRHVDLLCTHGYKADILGLIAGRLTGIRVVCFLRGWTGENSKIYLYETLDRFFLPLADRIVCLSENQAQRFRERHWGTSQIHIVPNAIDLPNYSPEQISGARRRLRELFGIPLNCAVIASAGRLSPEKGVGVFIDAAAQLTESDPNIRFLIFGDGALRAQLELKTKELGLTSYVRFAGFVPEVREFLPGLDILVNPSFSEEMPNIVLEAMAAAIPVVATSVGGVPEIAGPDQALSLVSPGNPRELAEAVSTLLGDRLYAIRLARQGLARVRQTYSPTRQRTQLRALYRDVISADHWRPASTDFCDSESENSKVLTQ